ncbi:MAG TPA: DUF1146 family protein [Pseudoneobacillus sp.]|nr:DUF1146 family protein [Pseudoneobacillus sp.]
MISSFGFDSLISIMANLFFIAISWWALQAIKLDRFLKPNRVMQSRALYILLSIALGSIISDFFLNYLLWSRQLPYIFK